MKRTENKMYNFMLFFISQTISELGTSMTGFATVIWMYSNSGQVMSSSLLAICSTVPYLTVSLSHPPIRLPQPEKQDFEMHS